MYLEQQNYNKETIRQIQKEQKDEAFPIVNGGYPTFNTCPHTTLDVSHLKHMEDNNSMHTLSIKLDDERYVTFCIMKLSKEQICIDSVYHGEGKTRVLNFRNGKTESFLDVGTLALIHDKNLSK